MPERPLVLLAEDDHEMRRMLADALRRDGYDVEELADGGRLLVRIARAHQSPPLSVSLILSDIRMPVCSGLDIVKGLREARWEVPVILMTAFGDDEVRERAAALGATLVDKPFALEDLRRTVRALLPTRS
jgi:DNA-binding response OmpR family regulator